MLQSKKNAKPLTPSATLSGKLLKKSGNKYQLSMQERFVKIDGKYLRYYKKESDALDPSKLKPEAIEKQTVDLETCILVRPYDLSSECKTFEIQAADGRVFSFVARDPAEMKVWIESIQVIRNQVKESNEQAKAAKLIAETPYRIRLFDEKGETALVGCLWLDLEELYPESKEGAALTLKEHIECATGVALYLADFVPETQKSGARVARYDVLAVGSVAVNRFLTERMGPALSDESSLLDKATLGDLHAMIVWLTQYQQTLRQIYCPVAEGAPNPTSCALCDRLPVLCDLYVNGRGDGSSNGAATHLVDHCLNVLKTLFDNPSDMLQRHQDGSFFTNAPTEMWSSLHDHLSLATSTSSPVLHVMVADKIAIALTQVVDIVESNVKKLGTKASPEIKEIELEFVSALANDCVLHIEEILVVINNFQSEEIRAKVDSIYNPVTIRLIGCGQACLQRLVDLVMADIDSTLSQVFTMDWLEGNQVQVAIATVTDYLSDFEVYLHSFWLPKFVSNTLEAITFQYIRAAIFKPEKVKRQSNSSLPLTLTYSSPATKEKKSFFSFGSKKSPQQSQVVSQSSSISSSGSADSLDDDEAICRADEESLGRLNQDINLLNGFFSKRLGQAKAQEVLTVMNEVSLMLQLPPDELTSHGLVRIAAYPSSGKAIYEIILACMRLRSDIADEDIEDVEMKLEPAVTAAAAAARQFAEDGIPEGQLGLQYLDVMPAGLQPDSSTEPKSFLAKGLKNMAGIPLAALKNIIQLDSASHNNNNGLELNEQSERDSELRRRRELALRGSSVGLVDEVLDVLTANDAELAALAEEREREEQELLERQEREASGIINLEGHLEKKSPAHNLWQNRWFKLSTRKVPVEQPGDTGRVYTLMWFKKQGGEVIKSADASKLKSIILVESSRQLSFNFTKQLVMLSSEVLPNEESVVVSPNTRESAGGLDKVITHFSFAITLADGKDHWLRASKVDKIIAWINALSQASGLAYDPMTKEWSQSAKLRWEEKRKATEQTDIQAKDEAEAQAAIAALKWKEIKHREEQERQEEERLLALKLQEEEAERQAAAESIRLEKLKELQRREEEQLRLRLEQQREPAASDSSKKSEESHVVAADSSESREAALAEGRESFNEDVEAMGKKKKKRGPPPKIKPASSDSGEYAESSEVSSLETAEPMPHVEVTISPISQPIEEQEPSPVSALEVQVALISMSELLPSQANPLHEPPSPISLPPLEIASSRAESLSGESAGSTSPLKSSLITDARRRERMGSPDYRERKVSFAYEAEYEDGEVSVMSSGIGESRSDDREEPNEDVVRLKPSGCSSCIIS